MNSETVITEAPNWLSELEAKRERRLKARLGHETGAGAPCLTCETKCPGLDLHFWRKICKNCKCSKENHDVHDDDIYGWTQFQLLGSKPNKIKRKIVLPGKKDEVELDWAPKGQNDTVEKYLKTIPPELLPVKGSQAAQNRKQLLQKQIPIHDIDPSLCHELTDAELKQMNDYIEHMKKNSVGVGHVVQASSAIFLADRCPKGLPTVVETVKLQSHNMPATMLTKPFEQMKLSPNCNKFVETEREPIRLGIIKDLHYPCNAAMRELDEFFDTVPKPVNMVDNNINLTSSNLPHYAQGKLNIYSDNQTPSSIGGIKDLAFSTYDPSLLQQQHNNNSTNNNNAADNNRRILQSFSPNKFHQVPEDNLVPSNIQIGAVRDINYYEPEVKSAIQHENPLLHHNNTGIIPQNVKPNLHSMNLPLPHCHRCTKPFNEDEFAIFVERSNSLFHSNCFKCAGCNQNLADMVYFYDKESNNIYCGRDFAKIRGIPRCQACDELIFVKEYCLAENCTYHVKHFCCFECDRALAGQNYIIEDSQPLCLPCFENIKASKCNGCLMVIKPDEQGANLNGVHFHATDECFACNVCKKPLLGEKLLLRNDKLYCSHICFKNG